MPRRNLAAHLALERDVQADVVRLYESLGCTVVRFSQGYRRGGTRQTPGIPDLKVYCARLRLTWWHELKAANGKQRPAQSTFERLVISCGERYVLGGMEVAIEFLRSIGLFAKPGHVPPKASVHAKP